MLSFPHKIPLQKIDLPAAIGEKAKLFVLRLDVIDHYAGGNKYFKLKYNLEEAKKQGHTKILTFGGAWSNHLAAVAAGMQSAVGSQQPEVIAVVRGEEPKKLSETLQYCKERGMQLCFVSREEYRKKNETEFIEELKNKFGNFYLLPEGGSNELAAKGCKEILNYVNSDFDYMCCPVGSGGTLAGIASGLKKNQKALGFVALKSGEYLEDAVNALNSKTSNFKLLHDYHFGGFAKTTPQLVSFKKEFEKQNGFELDYIYTSKMFYGIYDLLQKNFFKPGSIIIAIHSGGLQGNKGFTEL